MANRELMQRAHFSQAPSAAAQIVEQANAQHADILFYTN